VRNEVSRHVDILGEWRYSSTQSWTLTIDGGGWSASRPSSFTPRWRSPGIHWIGGWLGPRAGLDVVLQRKIPSPRRESNPDRPAQSQSLYQQDCPGSYLGCILGWRLGGPQKLYGRGDEKIFTSVSNATQIIQPVASHIPDWQSFIIYQGFQELCALHTCYHLPTNCATMRCSMELSWLVTLATVTSAMQLRNTISTFVEDLVHLQQWRHMVLVYCSGKFKLPHQMLHTVSLATAPWPYNHYILCTDTIQWVMVSAMMWRKLCYWILGSFKFQTEHLYWQSPLTRP